jgi:rSAM/selenodomain-associated transferase 2
MSVKKQYHGWMKISVIIPTLNEAATIGPLVKFIKDNGRDLVFEVIVVDAGSGDDTGIIAAKEGANVITTVQANRAMQMNMGANVSGGDVLYFIHADVQLVPSFANDIFQAVSEGYDSGCYRFVFDAPSILLKINGYFTRFDRIMCRGGDQTLFITEKAFNVLGGFDEYYTIMEDYELIIRLRKRYRFAIIPKNVIVSARKYKSNSWLRVQLANLFVFIMFFARRPPEKMKAFYRRMLSYR